MPDAPTFVTPSTDSDDMLYSDNDIQHGGTSRDDVFTDATFIADDTPLDANPYEDFLSADEPDEPDATLLEPGKRSPKAVKYEKKTRGLFATAIKITCPQEATLADSAALLLHGPGIAQKAGDLAAENARFAHMIDLVTDQTENPATALIVATAPLLFQIVRNHEPVVESEKPARTFKIPFTKRRFRFKVGIRLGKRMHNLTNDPKDLTAFVFNNPSIVDALKKQGINVASHD